MTARDTKTSAKKKEPVVVEPPKFEKKRYVNLDTIEIPASAWSTDCVKVGAMSRLDWKTKGARAAIIRRAFEICAAEGCHYIVIDGGLVSKGYIDARKKDELERQTPAQKKQFKAEVEEHVLEDMANELCAIIPLLQKPTTPENGVENVRIYIVTSLILDGADGEKIANLLATKRPDIRIYKQGGDRTRLKGVGASPEEKRKGREIGWLTLRNHRMPGQYASTSVEKEIQEEEAAAENFPDLWVVGGHGSSISKPGGGERKRPFISLPILQIPTPRKQVEPSIALNQIGLRIIKTSLDGEERLIRTWSLRDLAVIERTFITGIKQGAKEIHYEIVNALKDDRKGLHVGELSDILDRPREEIEREIGFLVEPKALTRTTFPGLYQDKESGRYNFHADWLQEKLRYPWPYDKGYHELRRLLFGCLHAGYTTTDYEYVRHEFVKIILKHDINVVELIGDITAGLKHGLVQRGQVIGNQGYTEQETFAAELMGTVFYDVFQARFEEKVGTSLGTVPSHSELKIHIDASLPLFLYIIGNHEAWQKDLGFTPGATFHRALVMLLWKHIDQYLQNRGMVVPGLYNIIQEHMRELPEYDAKYEFPGGIRTELIHPCMANAQTASIRAEHSLRFSKGCQLVDTANYHTAISVEKWDPTLGQRIATQAGAMTPTTDFEHGKLKTIDFGPIYVGIRHKDGRIFMSEHQFFSKPIMKEPLSKNIDINQLKDRLRLLRAPG